MQIVNVGTGVGPGLGPTQGDESVDPLQLCPSPVTAAEVSATLPLVIPSRSVAEGPSFSLSDHVVSCYE